MKPNVVLITNNIFVVPSVDNLSGNKIALDTSASRPAFCCYHLFSFNFTSYKNYFTVWKIIVYSAKGGQHRIQKYYGTFLVPLPVPTVVFQKSY